jgi:hypothetical protein
MTEAAQTIDQEQEPELTPKEVLQHHMLEAHTTSIEIRELLISKLRSDKVATPNEIFRIVKMYGDNVERAIEVAAKLAPYVHAKLESVETKSEIEYKYVIQAPGQMASVDDWAKASGAKYLELTDQAAVGQTLKPVKPSIHDFEDEEEPMEQTEDEDEGLKVKPAEKPLPAPTIKLTTKNRLN